MGKGKPGKKGGKGKGKKKRNKEAEEAERLAREEEERARQEAEEAAREAERLEKEIRDKENRRLADEKRVEELRRLQLEEKEAAPLLDQVRSNLARTIELQHLDEQWVEFTQCSNRPDVNFFAEFNAYLRDWEASTDYGLEETFARCQEAEEVIEQIEKLASSLYFQSNGSAERAREYQLYIRQIRKVVIQKLDNATAFILQHPDDFLTPKNEILLSKTTDLVRMGLWVNFASKGFRMKTIDFPELGITVEIPKALVLQSIAVRVIHLPNDNHLEHYNTNHLTLGGVLYIEVLQLPEQSKFIKGWNLRPVSKYPNSVERILYPLGNPNDGSTAITPGTTIGSLTVKLKIPDGLMVNKDLEVGWWDSEQQTWSQQGIQEYAVDKLTNIATFQTYTLTKMALFQPRSMEFPFLGWSLAPCADGRIKYTIKASRMAVVIVVDLDGTCELVSPDESFFAPFARTKLEPGALLNRLQYVGLNLCPATYEEEYVKVEPSKQVKDVEMESHLHQSIASISNSFTVAANKWNQQFAQDKACLLVQESARLSVDDEGDEESPVQVGGDDFLSILVERDAELDSGIKYSYVSQEDLDFMFSDIEENEKGVLVTLRNITSHAKLSTAVLSCDTCSEETCQRVESSEGTLQQLAIQHLLDLTRPFSFSDVLREQPV